MYILYLVLAGVQAWYAHKKGWFATPKGKAHYLILCCAELILMTAVRGRSVGSDTGVYLDALEYYSSLPTGEMLFSDLVKPFNFEFAYFGLVKLCALIDLPAPLFLALIASIIYIPIFTCIYRYSKLPYISILAYFAIGLFAYSLGWFRQMMALSIVLCGVEYIEKKQWIKYILTLLVAATFHTSALFAIVLYIAYYFPIKKFIKWILPAELLLLVLGRPISLLMVVVFPKYAGYIGGQYDQQGGTYLMLILLNVLLFVLMYLNYKGFMESRLIIAALTVAVFVQAVGYSMAVLGRGVTYFSFFAIFAFSDIAFAMLNKPEIYTAARDDALAVGERCVKFAVKHRITWQKVLWVVFVVGLLGLFLMSLLGNKYIFPFRFFFL